MPSITTPCVPTFEKFCGCDKKELQSGNAHNATDKGNQPTIISGEEKY